MASAQRSCSVLLLLAALAVATARPTYQDTTGTQMSHAQGYTFGSNVAGYLRLSTDICDIKAAIGTSDNPNYAEARRIYLDGKNSYKTDGTIRTLRELGTKSYAGEPVFDLYAKYFGTAAFLDQPVSFALAGDAPYTTVPVRNETIVKGLEANLQVVYLLHELDEAAQKIKDGKTGLADGAPHNIDETWAIYTGERPDCSLWGTSQKRAMEFGTMQTCDVSAVNAAMLTAHRNLYAAAASGNAAAFEQQRKEVIRLFQITYIQATLKYAQLLDESVADNDKPGIEANQAEAYAFFRTIEPFIAQANPQSAETIKEALTPGNPPARNTLSIVKPALEATYSKLGILPSEIGNYGAKQNLGCVKNAAAGVAAGASSVVMAAVAVLALLTALF